MQKILFSFVIILLSYSSFAQQNDFGTWNVFTVKITSQTKWSGYTEFQIRSISPFRYFFYHEIKAGLTYSFNKNASVTLGSGLYNTFNEGSDYEDYKKKKEFRIWQQFILKQSVSIIDLEHRFRIEQQFSKNYSNRIRYRLNASIPINNKEIIPKTVYAVIYDEVFFTEKAPNFARNRFHLGAGYVFDKKFTVQSGFLRQVDFLEDGNRKKNFLFTSLTYQL